MVEIIISMVQSTVYQFLYLMKNKIIHLVHSTILWALWGKRAFHSFVSENTAKYSTGSIFLSYKITGFFETFFLRTFLPGLLLKIFVPLVSTYTFVLLQVCFSKWSWAQIRSLRNTERTARSACLFNTLLLATQIRFATALLFVPEVAECLFPLWSSQLSLLRGNYSKQGFSFPQQSSPSAKSGLFHRMGGCPLQHTKSRSPSFL